MIFRSGRDMKIDIRSGRVDFDCGAVERGTSRDEFLDSPAGAGAELLLENGPHRTYRIRPEGGLAATVYFKGPRLLSVTWQLALSPDKESVWSVEHELERKELHDDWLRAGMGEPPYQYPWGRIESDYDPKGCASSVIINYAE
jgi:hypothetical protein